MENKIKIKRSFLYPILLVSFVLMFGNAAFGSSPSAGGNTNDNAVNLTEDLPLTSAWMQTNWPASNSFFNLCGSNNKVFARTWDSFNGGRMFITNNDGINWNQVGTADSSIDILSTVMVDSKILAGTWSGFMQSNDDGKTWNAFTSTGIPADAAIWSVVMINSTLYAGTTGAIYTSTNKGITWTEISSGIPANARITSIVSNEDNLFATSANHGVFKSTDKGTSWTTINTDLTDTNISQLVALDNKLFAVTLTGVYLSQNSGNSWTADASGIKKVNCLVAVKNQLIAGTEDKGAFLSVDNGLTWTTFNTGIPSDSRIWSLALTKDGIFAGTNSGIWFTSAPTGVGIEREIMEPLKFTLKQNYPNPFSTSTTISFSIPAKAFVSLKIYDQLGREVATILSEEIPAGNYTRKWDATDLKNGIYFYRLQAGSFSEAKKLMLLR